MPPTGEQPPVVGCRSPPAEAECLYSESAPATSTWSGPGPRNAVARARSRVSTLRRLVAPVIGRGRIPPATSRAKDARRSGRRRGALLVMCGCQQHGSCERWFAWTFGVHRLQLHASSCDAARPSRRSPARSTKHRWRRTSSRSSPPRRPSCCSWRCSWRCSSGWCSPVGERRWSCPTACCSARPRRTRNCGGCWSRTAASTVAARRRLQALRRRVDGHPAVHQDGLWPHRPRVVLRPRRRRPQPRRQAHRTAAARQARSRRGRGADPRRTRREQPARRPARWFERGGTERDRARTDQSFCVPKAEIVAQGYDLSINRYKEIVHVEVEHRDPKDIIKELVALEDDIRQGLADLESML